MGDFEEGVRIYNLFPRLVGPMERWTETMARAKGMGFNWIYINPFHLSGFSGSLYAVKDYYRFNPLFLAGKGGDGWAQLSRVVKWAHGEGLRLMMDLVINHTAIDSPLTRAHPAWYRRDEGGKIRNPTAIDPADARKVTVWGDLAEIDNAASADRESLWGYWERLVERYIEAGFDGFRCDAAYQVPGELWKRLIARARGKREGTVFLAETLGCTEAQTAEIARCGFDYVTNSSKWWDFSEPWCLRQYGLTRRMVPSVSFPETHDTERLAAESGGDPRVSKMRYAFAAFFSKGLLMPIGYEFGFRKPCDVVRASPGDWERPLFDLSDSIGKINRMKARWRVMNEEGPQEAVGGHNPHVLVLLRATEDGREKALLLLNRNPRNFQTIRIGSLCALVRTDRVFRDVSPEFPMDFIPDVFEYHLHPAQAKILVASPEE